MKFHQNACTSISCFVSTISAGGDIYTISKQPLVWNRYQNYHFTTPKMSASGPLPVRCLSTLLSSVSHTKSIDAVFRIAIPLALAAGTADLLEHNTKIGSSLGGSLVSFLCFAALSNLKLVPSASPIFDACWSTLLPMALVCILFGQTPLTLPFPFAERNRGAGREMKREIKSEDGELNPRLMATGGKPKISPLKKVSIAYVVGAASSIVGVSIGLQLALAGPVPSLRMAPGLALKCAAVLLASYVGGSINFFAVADAVGLSSGNSSVLGAMAAADILFMALYFSGLLVASRSTRLQNSFPKDTEEKALGNPDGFELQQQSTQGAFDSKGLLAACGVVTASYALARCADALAQRAPLPGASTGLLTAATLGLTAWLSSVLPRSFYSKCMAVSRPLARFFLNIFFAAIGASARFADIIGIGAPILGLAGVGLLVHCLMMAFLVKMANTLFGCEISLNQLLVASNANIGGPSTAATFASSIQQDSLVMPATLVGTAGYALATSLGICFAHLGESLLL